MNFLLQRVLKNIRLFSYLTADAPADRVDGRLLYLHDSVDPAGPVFVDHNGLRLGLRGSGGGDDKKVMVSSTDTTPDYLENKVTAGSGVSVTKVGSPGDEHLSVAATGSSRGSLELALTASAQLSLAQLRANKLIVLSNAAEPDSVPFLESAHESTFPGGYGGNNLFINIGMYPVPPIVPSSVLTTIEVPFSPNPPSAAALAAAVTASTGGHLVGTVVNGRVRIAPTSPDAVWIRVGHTAVASAFSPAHGWAPDVGNGWNGLAWANNRGAESYFTTQHEGSGIAFGPSGSLTLGTDVIWSASPIPMIGTLTAMQIAANVNAVSVANGVAAWVVYDMDDTLGVDTLALISRNPGNPSDPVESRAGHFIYIADQSPAGTIVPVIYGSSTGPYIAPIDVSLANGEAGLDILLTQDIMSAGTLNLVGSNLAVIPTAIMNNDLLPLCWDGVSKWYLGTIAAEIDTNKIKVSAVDILPDYLGSKLQAGPGISITQSGVGNLALTVAASPSSRGALHLPSPPPAQISIAQIRANNFITLSDTTVLPSLAYIESADESTFPTGLGGQFLCITVGKYAAPGSVTASALGAISLPVSPNPLDAATIVAAINTSMAGQVTATVVGGKVHIATAATSAVWISCQGTVAAALGFTTALQWAHDAGDCPYVKTTNPPPWNFGTGNITLEDSIGIGPTIVPVTGAAATAAQLRSAVCAGGATHHCTAWIILMSQTTQAVVIATDPGNPTVLPHPARGAFQVTIYSETPTGVTGLPIGTVYGTDPLRSSVSIEDGAPGDAGLGFLLAKNLTSINDIDIVSPNLADPFDPGTGISPIQLVWDGVSKWYWS